MPLELKIFVPCCSENNVLEEPIENDFKDSKGFINNAFFIEMTEYKKALSEVIFESFKESKEVSFAFGSFENRTIEDLVKYNLKLTDNAIKKYKF